MIATYLRKGCVVFANHGHRTIGGPGANHIAGAAQQILQRLAKRLPAAQRRDQHGPQG